jgi:hypothetical protein
MLVQEKDAVHLWCPMTRMRNENGGSSYNIVPYAMDEFAGAKCVASSCMMWRYENDDPRDTKGYCGLAGPTKY